MLVDPKSGVPLPFLAEVVRHAKERHGWTPPGRMAGAPTFLLASVFAFMDSDMLLRRISCVCRQWRGAISNGVGITVLAITHETRLRILESSFNETKWCNVRDLDCGDVSWWTPVDLTLASLRRMVIPMNIRSFSIGLSSIQNSAIFDRTLELLSRCSGVTRLALDVGRSTIPTIGDVARALALLPNLKTLELGGPFARHTHGRWTMEWIKTHAPGITDLKVDGLALDEKVHEFPHLISLTIGADTTHSTASLGSIVPSLSAPMLRKLTIVVEYSGDHLMGPKYGRRLTDEVGLAFSLGRGETWRTLTYLDIAPKQASDFAGPFDVDKLVPMCPNLLTIKMSPAYDSKTYKETQTAYGINTLPLNQMGFVAFPRLEHLFFYPVSFPIFLGMDEKGPEFPALRLLEMPNEQLAAGDMSFNTAPFDVRFYKETPCPHFGFPSPKKKASMGDQEEEDDDSDED